MDTLKIRRALIAVYDKTGIAAFARALADEFGIEIISTGGTAKHLQEAGIPVTLVEQVTGFPEMLDGRVKTLHPKIHAAILADRDNPEHMRQLAEHGIQPIDMVVVNLYPFEKTVADPNCKFEDAIEMIDIGGPCMLRAAAKNHKHVLVVCQDPAFYDSTLYALRNWRDPIEKQDALVSGGVSAYLTTARYDIKVSSWLAAQHYEGQSPWPFIEAYSWGPLRYGENPHQEAELLQLYGDADQADLTAADMVLDEQEISFNNYADADAAFQLCQELTWATKPADCSQPRLSGPYVVAFIKHMNACGCAIGDAPIDTYRRAYLGDPIAAAGGVLCMNFPVTREIADIVMNSFGRWGKAAGAAFFKLDLWMAPSFEDDALELIRTPTERRKWGASCRFLCNLFTDKLPTEPVYDYKRISGGLLKQTRDLLGLNEEQWKVVTKRAPSESEMSDLRFAWLVCKHTKSNAITVVRDGMLLGNGAGQMSRVKSCDLAIQLARENGHGDKLAGAVAAGDAFFPVPDGPGKLIEAGISAMIQPGGGNRDAETIAACDRAGVAMILTGTRHFKH